MSGEFIVFFKEQFILIIYVVTLIISIYHFRKYFDTALKYFPLIIAYTFFNELLGYFIRYSDKFAFFSDLTSANDIIYNIYALVFFGFFFYVYHSIISDRKSKGLIKILSVTVLLGFLVNSLFQNPLKVSLYYALSFASIVLVITIIFYFNNRKEWKWEIEKYNLVTWVSLGLALFYSIFPFVYLSGYLEPGLWEIYPMRTVLRILIVFMYFLFCVGFIKSRRRAFR